jgi:DNA invertase Pin-like site-specific DNA recombinase
MYFMKPAFSYIRFSSPEQAKGDSFRRQSEAAAAWAQTKGYTIVRSLEDLGISAYRGQNVQVGEFAEFLLAAETKQLPQDCVLIVENLDRMSRQAPRRALLTFLRLIEYGIGIVTLTDGVLHTAESLDNDQFGMGLFGALMVMIRANSESRTKGNRVAAAWSRKRTDARDKAIPLTDRIPNWLTSKRDSAGRRVFIENGHADTVRRIFAETAQGLGRRMIAKGLNREIKETFRSKNGWQTSTIAKIVASRTALGEYQPCRRDESGNIVPDGGPILGYYPAVVDEALWTQANAAIRLRRRNGGGRPQRQGLNLIPGLGWCVCGARMAFLNKGAPPKGGQYFACSASQREATCTNSRLWSAKAVERYLIHQIDPARLEEAIEPPEIAGPPARNFDAEIADLEAKRQGAIASILRNPDNALGAEMERQANTLSDQISETRRQRDAVVAEDRSRPHLPTVRSALQDVASLATELESASAEDKLALRMRLTHQIRTAYAEIVFGPHTISGLIALPGMPKSMKGFFGLPKPIVAKTTKDGSQRWFYRNMIFSDEPELVESMGGGTGVLGARR